MEEANIEIGGLPSKLESSVPQNQLSQNQQSTQPRQEQLSQQQSHGISKPQRRRYTGPGSTHHLEALPSASTAGIVPTQSIAAAVPFDHQSSLPGTSSSAAQSPVVLQPHQLPQNILQPSFQHQRSHSRQSSITHKTTASHHERKQSRSSDKAATRQDQSVSNNSWNNGRKNSLSIRNSVPNMQTKRSDQPQQPPTQARPPFRPSKSNQSLSNSLPSTPQHSRTPVMNGKSRSPSPPNYSLDSPRSAASDPVHYQPSHRPLQRACPFEIGLATSRRRMPYSLGAEPLPKEKPSKVSLSEEEDRILTKAIEDLYQNLLPSPESQERRKGFVTKLDKMLNDEWPGQNIKCHPFGSTENHLSTNESDVDICITTTMKELENVCMLAATLSKRRMERIVCVHAKVPIVKIWDPEFDVACDMNVNNTLALENTRMIKTYVEIDPRVRPLAMILKYWTKKRILNDAAGGGTLPSYTWICMIINYLQTRDPPILPALHQRGHEKKPLVHGVDVSFDDDIEKLKGFGDKNTESLGTLLFGFFKFYAYELEFENHVISVRQGKLLPKSEKNWGNLNRLQVEEPFNIMRNLGNPADDTSVRGLHLEFRRAFEALAESSPNLDLCCEQYVFPKEEPVAPPPPKQSQARPIVARAHSASGKGIRPGGNPNTGGGNRNRQYQPFGSARSSHQYTAPGSNRRASSGAILNPLTYAQPLFQPTETYCVFQGPDGTLSFGTFPTNNIPRLSQDQSQAGSTRLPGQLGHGSSNKSNQQQAANHLQALNIPFPYVPFYPLLYYPQAPVLDQSTAVLNSAILQGAVDSRTTDGRTTRSASGTSLRSRSQPAPQSAGGQPQRGSRFGNAQTQQSDDEHEFGDFPVNGQLNGFQSPSSLDMQHGQSHQQTSHMHHHQHQQQQHQQHQQQQQQHLHHQQFATAPIDEYYGYMIREPSKLAPSDLFVGQKDVVDRQRRLSKEMLPPLKFSDNPRSSQPPSPIVISQRRYSHAVPEAVWSSDGDGERSLSQDSFEEEPASRHRGPLIVNGSGGSVPVTPPYDDSGFVTPGFRNESPPSETYAFEHHSMYGDLPAKTFEHIGTPYYTHNMVDPQSVLGGSPPNLNPTQYGVSIPRYPTFGSTTPVHPVSYNTSVTPPRGSGQTALGLSEPEFRQKVTAAATTAAKNEPSKPQKLSPKENKTDAKSSTVSKDVISSVKDVADSRGTAKEREIVTQKRPTGSSRNHSPTKEAPAKGHPSQNGSANSKTTEASEGGAHQRTERSRDSRPVTERQAVQGRQKNVQSSTTDSNTRTTPPISVSSSNRTVTRKSSTSQVNGTTQGQQQQQKISNGGNSNKSNWSSVKSKKNKKKSAAAKAQTPTTISVDERKGG